MFTSLVSVLKWDKLNSICCFRHIFCCLRVMPLIIVLTHFASIFFVLQAWAAQDLLCLIPQSLYQLFIILSVKLEHHAWFFLLTVFILLVPPTPMVLSLY